jgi:transcriptional regulator
MPERRQFLAALSLLATDLAAEEEADETIYIPDRHVETDRAWIRDFIDEYSFAMVVTAHQGLRVTNVPTLFTRTAEGWGKIWFHIAKNNRQQEALNADAETLIVFHGAHGYISPNWYVNPAGVTAVPTWNFAVVHATGRARRLDDDALFATNLSQLVTKNESKYGGGPWNFQKLPDSYLKGMRQGIIQYEMTIQNVEAKFKLGQERSPADQTTMLKGISAAPHERTLPELSRAYFALHAARKPPLR